MTQFVIFSLPISPVPLYWSVSITQTSNSKRYGYLVGRARLSFGISLQLASLCWTSLSRECHGVSRAMTTLGRRGASACCGFACAIVEKGAFGLVLADIVHLCPHILPCSAAGLRITGEATLSPVRARSQQRGLLEGAASRVCVWSEAKASVTTNTRNSSDHVQQHD